jgi:membrane protein
MNPPSRTRRLWTLLSASVSLWLSRNAFIHAGALAFYTLFSMAPILVVAVGIAGAVFGEEAARGEVMARLATYVGAEAARVIERALADARPTVAGVLPTVAGALVVVAGATTVFAQLQVSLNRIWGVAPHPHRSSIMLFLRSRALSALVVLAIGILLLGLLVLNVAFVAVVNRLGWGAESAVLATAAEMLLSVAVLTALFAVLFRVLPQVELSWRDVGVGAAVTALLFVVGRLAIAMYLARTAPASAFGAAGALALILLWVYYSALIFFFGAALIRTRLVLAGRPVVPRATAALVTEHIAGLDE